MLCEDILGALWSRDLTCSTACRLGLISCSGGIYLMQYDSVRREHESSCQQCKANGGSPHMPSLSLGCAVSVQRKNPKPFYDLTTCWYNQMDFQLSVQSRACKHISAGNRVGYLCLFSHYGNLLNLFGSILKDTRMQTLRKPGAPRKVRSISNNSWKVHSLFLNTGDCNFE